LQLPQLFESVAVSTHDGPHIVRGEPQAGGAHEPAAHVALLGHAIPHVPQCIESVCRFAHVAPHRVSPDGHPQTPALHAMPVPHAFVHEPHCALLVCRSTHVPLQSVSASVHRHAPLVQAIIAPHITPQTPQFIPSLCVSTHAPLHSVVCTGQVQTDPVHVVIGAVQTRSHAPQFAGSELVSTQPAVQYVCGGGHIGFTSKPPSASDTTSTRGMSNCGTSIGPSASSAASR
jgi:hypothetical protein